MKEIKRSSIKMKNRLYDAVHTKGAEIGFYELAVFKSTLDKIKKLMPKSGRGEKDIAEAKRVYLRTLYAEEHEKFLKEYKQDFIDLYPIIQDEQIDVMAERNKVQSENVEKKTEELSVKAERITNEATDSKKENKK